MTNIKVLSKSFIYGRQQTQSSQLVYCGCKFKLTYDNGNAWEHFTIKLFDGDKFNPIAEMIVGMLKWLLTGGYITSANENMN